jgi:hypothetical protein
MDFSVPGPLGFLGMVGVLTSLPLVEQALEPIHFIDRQKTAPLQTAQGYGTQTQKAFPGAIQNSSGAAA